jgi:hypothetical protein
VIFTNHEPNTYLDTATSAHTIKRGARWLDISCGYNYTWCYRPGRTNVADPISRAPQHFDALCASLSVAHMVGICRARSADCGTPGHGLAVERTVSGRLLSAASAAICCSICAQAVTRTILRALTPYKNTHLEAIQVQGYLPGWQLLRGGVSLRTCVRVPGFHMHVA